MSVRTLVRWPRSLRARSSARWPTPRCRRSICRITTSRASMACRATRPRPPRSRGTGTPNSCSRSATKATSIVQVSKTGQVINSMSLTGFLDTEGMTYIGNGKFVVTEERRQQAFLLTYNPNGTVDKSALQMAQLGPQLGDGGCWQRRRRRHFLRSAHGYVRVREGEDSAGRELGEHQLHRPARRM